MIDIYKHLTPHFQLYEFLHYGSLEGVTPTVVYNLQKLAEALESIRVICGNRQIIIYSGFRTPQHNREVGGASQSYHIQGMAADFIIYDQSVRETQRRLRNWHGGLGSYATWSHIDIGPKRQWEGP